MPHLKTFVEVGVYKGHSILFLAHQLKLRSVEGVKIYAVDNGFYLYKEAGSSVSIYDLNLKLAGVREMVTDIIGDSARSAAQFPDNSLDFVFIDASHDYDSVKRDIKAWLPKVRKPNGIIAGHDYCEVWPGVIKAVHEEFGLDLEIVQSDWVWCKTFS